MSFPRCCRTCYRKCGPGPGIIITWECVRDANSQTIPRPNYIQVSEVGPCSLGTMLLRQWVSPSAAQATDISEILECGLDFEIFQSSLWDSNVQLGLRSQLYVIFLLNLYPSAPRSWVNKPVVLPAAPIFCMREFKGCFQLTEASFDVPEKQIPQSTQTDFGPDPIYLKKGGERSPCSLCPNSTGGI